MRELYDLKQRLCKELEDYGRKGDVNMASLDIIDKLAHSIKNIDKVIEAYEGGHDGGNSYGMGNNNYPYPYAGGQGSYARRDSLGRYSNNGMYGYSRTGDMMTKMQEMIDDAPDERTRMELQRIMDKMR